MGISVEGQKCPICKAYLFDNDDLVFCPECGAPHHRDCYAALGHCAYKDKHGTSEGYKKLENKTSENNAEKNEEPKNDYRSSGRLCRFCGREIPEGQNICPSCGRPQIGTAYTPFGTPIMLDPMGGVHPDETIDGVPAKEIANYVAVNTQRYIPRFKSMEDKRKKSWNWAAFFWPNAWFFYRKMYFAGALFFILLVTTSLFSIPLSSLIGTLPDEARNSYVTIIRYLTENMGNINQTPIYLATAGGVASLVIRFFAGFTADRIYRKSVIQGVEKVKTEGTDLDTPLELELRKKGGVSMIFGMVGLFALEWSTMFLYILL